jgi:hypothetical protein
MTNAIKVLRMIDSGLVLSKPQVLTTLTASHFPANREINREIMIRNDPIIAECIDVPHDAR